MVSLYQVPGIYRRYFCFTALATLKPQAGLVAPQAIPASQQAAAVSLKHYNFKLLVMI